MAGKNSKTAADAATESAGSDGVIPHDGVQTETVITPPPGTANDGADAAAEVIPPPIPTGVAADRQDDAFVVGELITQPVKLHPDSLAQLADLLGARLAPAPAPVADPAPAEIAQPTAPRVTCRALQPIEHDGVLYGPGSHNGDEFDVTKTGLAQLKSINAVEEVADETPADPGEAGKKEA